MLATIMEGLVLLQSTGVFNLRSSVSTFL